jgi:hypothetical protein
MKSTAGQPLAFETVKALDDKVEEFFISEDAFIINFKDGKEEKIFAPTMAGLALYLGVDRRTVVNYSNKEEYFPTIRKARARIESHLEKKLYGNNVTGLIFNLKNNFNWKDKTEVEQTNVDLTHEQWLDTLE